MLRSYRLTASFAVVATLKAAHEEAQLRIYGNTTTIELAPVLLDASVLREALE